MLQGGTALMNYSIYITHTHVFILMGNAKIYFAIASPPPFPPMDPSLECLLFWGKKRGYPYIYLLVMHVDILLHTLLSPTNFISILKSQQRSLKGIDTSTYP